MKFTYFIVFVWQLSSVYFTVCFFLYLSIPYPYFLEHIDDTFLFFFYYFGSIFSFEAGTDSNYDGILQLSCSHGSIPQVSLKNAFFLIKDNFYKIMRRFFKKYPSLNYQKSIIKMYINHRRIHAKVHLSQKRGKNKKNRPPFQEVTNVPSCQTIIDHLEIDHLSIQSKNDEERVQSQLNILETKKQNQISSKQAQVWDLKKCFPKIPLNPLIPKNQPKQEDHVEIMEIMLKSIKKGKPLTYTENLLMKKLKEMNERIKEVSISHLKLLEQNRSLKKENQALSRRQKIEATKRQWLQNYARSKEDEVKTRDRGEFEFKSKIMKVHQRRAFWMDDSVYVKVYRHQAEQ